MEPNQAKEIVRLLKSIDDTLKKVLKELGHIERNTTGDC